MDEIRRIDLWIGRGAAVAGICCVVVARLWSFGRLRGIAIVAATVLGTIALALFVTIHAYAAGPDDWALPLRVGLFGIGPGSDRPVAADPGRRSTARNAYRRTPAAGS